MPGRLPARAPRYPRKRARLLWGLLECLCFCGLTASWDMLFPLFLRANLLFYPGSCCQGNVSTDSVTIVCGNGYHGDISEDSWNNISRSSNMSENCSRLTTCYASCRDVPVLFALPFLTSLLISIFLVPFGIFYIRSGTLRTRLISIAMFTASTLMMAFMSQEDTWMLAVSWFLLSVSGLLVLITNLQLTNLSRSKRGLLIMLYHSARENSAAFVALIKLTAGVSSLQTSYMFLTVGMVPLLVGTIAFLPKGRLLWPLAYNHAGSATSLQQYFTKQGKRDTSARHPGSTWASSFIFWSQIFWLFGLLYPLKLLEEISVLNLIKQGHAVLLDRHILLGGLAAILACPLVGISLDRYNGHKEEPDRRRTFIVSTCSVTSVAGVLVLLLAAASFINTHSLDVATLTVSRGLGCLCLGIQTVVLSTLFSYEDFGRIVGVSLVFSELSAVSAYLVLWMLEQQWISVSAILSVNILLILTTFLHVLIKWRLRNSQELSTFASSSYVMESIARATLTFGGGASLNSIEVASGRENDEEDEIS